MAGKMMPLAMMLMLESEKNRRVAEEGGRMAYPMRDEPWEPDHRRKMTYVPPYGEPEMSRMNYPRSEYDGDGMNDRRMGFAEPPIDNYPEMRRRRRSDGTFMHYGASRTSEAEPIRFGGMVSMEGGYRHEGNQKMTREMAEDWVDGMHGDDPAKPHGGKWTMDQVKPIAQKYGVPTDGERFWEFWAVMNAMYSDYFSIAKKYAVDKPDFYADMAMAFINDKDAVKDKAVVYYDCIAKR